MMRKLAPALAPILALIAILAITGCQKKPSQAAAPTAAETAEAKAFLEKTAKEPGVKTLPSGLMYKVVRAGSAGASPHPGDEVKVNYEGKLAATGEVFDSTYQRGQPAILPLHNLVPAWLEALPMMKPGDEWLLYVPAKLGYGDHGAGETIPPGAVLVFRIELLAFLPTGPHSTLPLA